MLKYFISASTYETNKQVSLKRLHLNVLPRFLRARKYVQKNMKNEPRAHTFKYFISASTYKTNNKVSLKRLHLNVLARFLPVRKDVQKSM